MMNESDGYFVEDGKVKNYRVDERYKTFMIWLQKLYGEGLINEEVITQDYSKFQSLARGEGSTAKLVLPLVGKAEIDSGLVWQISICLCRH